MSTINKESDQQSTNKLSNVFIERVKYALDKTRNSIMTNFKTFLSSSESYLDHSKQDIQSKDEDRLPPKIEVWLETYMSQPSVKIPRGEMDI